MAMMNGEDRFVANDLNIMKDVINNVIESSDIIVDDEVSVGEDLIEALLDIKLKSNFIYTSDITYGLAGVMKGSFNVNDVIRIESTNLGNVNKRLSVNGIEYSIIYKGVSYTDPIEDGLHLSIRKISTNTVEIINDFVGVTPSVNLSELNGLDYLKNKLTNTTSNFNNDDSNNINVINAVFTDNLDNQVNFDILVTSTLTNGDLFTSLLEVKVEVDTADGETTPKRSYINGLKIYSLDYRINFEVGTSVIKDGDDYSISIYIKTLDDGLEILSKVLVTDIFTNHILNSFNYANSGTYEDVVEDKNKIYINGDEVIKGEINMVNSPTIDTSNTYDLDNIDLPFLTKSRFLNDNGIIKTFTFMPYDNEYDDTVEMSIDGYGFLYYHYNKVSDSSRTLIAYDKSDFIKQFMISDGFVSGGVKQDLKSLYDEVNDRLTTILSFDSSNYILIDNSATNYRPLVETTSYDNLLINNDLSKSVNKETIGNSLLPIDSLIRRTTSQNTKRLLGYKTVSGPQRIINFVNNYLTNFKKTNNDSIEIDEVGFAYNMDLNKLAYMKENIIVKELEYNYKDNTNPTLDVPYEEDGFIKQIITDGHYDKVFDNKYHTSVIKDQIMGKGVREILTTPNNIYIVTDSGSINIYNIVTKTLSLPNFTSLPVGFLNKLYVRYNGIGEVDTIFGLFGETLYGVGLNIYRSISTQLQNTDIISEWTVIKNNNDNSELVSPTTNELLNIDFSIPKTILIQTRSKVDKELTVYKSGELRMFIREISNGSITSNRYDGIIGTNNQGFIQNMIGFTPLINNYVTYHRDGDEILWELKPITIFVVINGVDTYIDTYTLTRQIIGEIVTSSNIYGYHKDTNNNNVYTTNGALNIDQLRGEQLTMRSKPKSKAISHLAFSSKSYIENGKLYSLNSGKYIEHKGLPLISNFVYSSTHIGTTNTRSKGLIVRSLNNRYFLIGDNMSIHNSQIKESIDAELLHQEIKLPSGVEIYKLSYIKEENMLTLVILDRKGIWWFKKVNNYSSSISNCIRDINNFIRIGKLTLNTNLVTSFDDLPDRDITSFDIN